MHRSLAVLVLAAGVAAADAPADLILTRGRVWTAEADRRWAEAVAVRGERIVAVGSSAEVEALRGPKTEVLDLAGRLVLPGFNGAHIPLLSGSPSLDEVLPTEDQAA